MWLTHTAVSKPLAIVAIVLAVVELQITRPIEDAVSGLQNIDTNTSTSGQGVSSVAITFTDKAMRT